MPVLAERGVRRHAAEVFSVPEPAGKRNLNPEGPRRPVSIGTRDTPTTASPGSPPQRRVVFTDPSQTVYQALSALLTSTLSHRIPPHLDAMGVVHEPVEDAVSQHGIAYLFALLESEALSGADYCHIAPAEFGVGFSGRAALFLSCILISRLGRRQSVLESRILRLSDFILARKRLSLLYLRCQLERE